LQPFGLPSPLIGGTTLLRSREERGVRSLLRAQPTLAEAGLRWWRLAVEEHMRRRPPGLDAVVSSPLKAADLQSLRSDLGQRRIDLVVLSSKEQCVACGGDVAFSTMRDARRQCLLQWGAWPLHSGVGSLHDGGCGATQADVEDHPLCYVAHSRSGLRNGGRCNAHHRCCLPRWRYDAWLVVMWTLGGRLLDAAGVRGGIGWRLVVEWWVVVDASDTWWWCCFQSSPRMCVGRS
jgi:hypothetical protein